jgi:peptidoglycan-N-acetylglucosamine deacetylase
VGVDHIFQDSSGRRWLFAKIVLSTFAIAVALIFVCVVVGTVVSAHLPSLSLSSDLAPVVVNPLGDEPADIPIDTTTARRTLVFANTAFSHRQVFRQLPFVRSAFVEQKEARSIESLLLHLSQLDVVYPDWLHFANSDGEVEISVNAEAATLMKSAGVFIVPRIANVDARGEWFVQGLPRLFGDAQATDKFINVVVAALEDGQADGINLDIEGVREEDGELFVEWLRRIANGLQAHGFIVTVDVPVNEVAYDLKKIGEFADAVVLMTYDEHFDRGEAGPIASRDWFNTAVADALRSMPRDKLIVGIGAYAYDWSDDAKEASSLGIGEAMQLAARRDARIYTDPRAINNRFDYRDERGVGHHVWLLDAVSAWNQVVKLRHDRPRGLALWRAGLEEQSIWSFFGNDAKRPLDSRSLGTMPALRMVSFEGNGELLSVSDEPENGTRVLKLEDDFIVGTTIDRWPRGFQVERRGKLVPKQIALTFDDGPDPVWTPQILNILAEHGIRATFFVIGERGERYQKILWDEFATGHLIGNHTYLHPHLGEISNLRLKWEINATQRVVQAVTGHSTVLFRSPYDVDVEPTLAEQLYPLHQATQMGYLVVRAAVDSKDYEKPGSDRIVENVMTGLHDNDAHVIVFHDGGGDRQQTVAALKKLIPQLAAQGYQFVGIEDLLGLKTSALMPSITGVDRVFAFVTTGVIRLRVLLWKFLIGFFFFATSISVIRLATLGALLVRGRSGTQSEWRSSFNPDVRVLIPAHNEATVIARTLEAVLKSDYSRLHVTVIDDGSTDVTARIVEEFAGRDRRVHLVTQLACMGKAAALNRGFCETPEDYLVTIDADTIVYPHTVRKLVEPFSDPAIDAVCGNVRVGNVRNILTRFQHVEYVTSQNYDRRAFSSVNGISVVPGATGAWRRRKVLEIGGYSEHTLTEDTDLTLTLLARGGRIVYAPLAQSVTEAPETIGALFRQRYRWSFGSLQCLWKHRKRCGRGALGLIVLPNIFINQILFPVLAPLGDGLLGLSLLHHDVTPIAIGCAMFLGIDLVSCVVAFQLDGQNLRHASVIVIQRFFYRQFMYVVTFAAIFGALRGRRCGWNKLHRLGTCLLPTTPHRGRHVDLPTAFAA